MVRPGSIPLGDANSISPSLSTNNHVSLVQLEIVSSKYRGGDAYETKDLTIYRTRELVGNRS